MHGSVNPISSIREKKSDESIDRKSKPVDSKVKGLAFERISQTKGGLLPSTSVPQILIDLRPALNLSKGEATARHKRKPKLRKTPLVQGIPIGLKPVDPEGGVNALMQFVLHVPGFAEHFFFSPRSFSPFQEFIDQYSLDQQENRSLSSANGGAIFRFLALKVPDLCLHDIFRFLSHVLQTKWELYQTLEEALKGGRPPDLFAIRSSPLKQLFLEPDLGYDLDAFIELRPDGVSGSFIAYVKVNGIWYQCDDERITLLRSNALSVPLNRAILFHYKRISFSKFGWI